jgi:cell fate regulator YaaT (PSP1 superfamily)
MAEIVGVRFKKGGKVYYFNPKGVPYKLGDSVVVETAKGVECGEIVIENKECKNFTQPLKEIVRKVNENDLKTLENNKKKEQEAFKVCEQKIASRNLGMKLIDVECTFDNNKLMFYFIADTRVDFRELVKDLASVFHTRIELRQIGVRDQAKFLGGLGICGRQFCCKGYLGDFEPVSIKMAKEQSLSLNPSKISGSCGRLMCCLKYEQDGYEELLKITPKVGAVVKVNNNKGIVQDVNVLTGRLKVIPYNSDVPIMVKREDVILIKDSEIRLNRDEIRALKNLE